LAGSVVGAFLLWPARPATAGQPTAVLTVVPAPTPTATPRPSPTPPALTPTPMAPPPPLPGQIGVGVFVQVRGTGGDGLRVRQQPGLDATPLFLAREDEVFQVVAGPEIADGYTWWHLQAPYDARRSGWAVSNYLAVLPTPPAPTPTP